MKLTSRLPLFRSPEQERILAELFVFARQPLSLSEVARRTGVSVPGVHKEVERMEKSGLVSSTISGRSRLVEPNRDSPVYEDLRALLTKSLGPEPLLRDALSSLDGIEEAFIFGSWADPNKMAPHDIDLMVIGNPNPSDVYDAIAGVETEVGRSIDVVLRSRDEWTNADGGFEQTIRSRPSIPVR